MALEGLLGNFNLSPEDKSSLFQGLLAGVGAALASRGTPVQAIGQGLLGGISGYAGGQQLAAQSAWRNMQAENARALADQRRLEMEQMQRRNAYLSSGGAPSTSPSPGGGSTEANAQAMGQPRYTFAGLLQAGFSPDEAQKIISGGGPQINNIDVKDYTQDSLATFMQTRNPADLVAVRKREVANGVAYDPYSVAPGTVFNDVNQPFLRDQNGNIVPNTPYQRFQLQKAAAGAARTNVSVDAAPKSFWTDFGKSASDQLFKEREAAQAAASTLQGLDEIRKAAAGGAFQGAGADMKLGAARALRSLGMNISPNEVANSEQFNAIAGQFVLNHIKQLGANPSNADREFIEKTVPRLSTDPAALPGLLDYMESKARGQVESYNNKIRGVQQQPGAQFLPYSLEVPIPQPQRRGAQSAPGDISDLLNKYGGAGGR